MVVLWFLQNCGGGRVAIMAFGPMGYGYAMSDNLLRCDALCQLRCMSVSLIQIFPTLKRG